MEIVKAKSRWLTVTKSKDLWKAVNVTLGKNSADPLRSLYAKYPDRHTAASAIKEIFVNSFCPSVTNPDVGLCCSPNAVDLFDWIVLITVQTVYDQLKMLKVSKASPLIPTIILYKHAAPFLCYPLEHLFSIFQLNKTNFANPGKLEL